MAHFHQVCRLITGDILVIPNPDKRDKCVNEIIFCQKNAKNNFLLTKHRVFPLGLLLILIFSGCGGIRFVQVAPEARDFHPRAIALLSSDMGGHQEAQDILDQVITSELADTKWFQNVLSAQSVQRLLQENEVLRKTTSEYLGKLKEVNFSDSNLSREIGKLTQVDAFLLINVDYWYYTKKADKNIAKVGLGMRLINAENGLLVWKAGHDLAPEYVFLKPELSDVARSVVRQMVKAMPH